MRHELKVRGLLEALETGEEAPRGWRPSYRNDGLICIS
jgi:hypothetical protein